MASLKIFAIQWRLNDLMIMFCHMHWVVASLKNCNDDNQKITSCRKTGIQINQARQWHDSSKHFLSSFHETWDLTDKNLCFDTFSLYFTIFFPPTVNLIQRRPDNDSDSQPLLIKVDCLYSEFCIFMRLCGPVWTQPRPAVRGSLLHPLLFIN